MGISTSSFGTWQICRSAGPSSSAAVPREVIMLAIATAALIVLATAAEALFVKYDSESYKHEDYDSYNPYEHRSGDYYPEPSHKSHYSDKYYGHKPSYEVQDDSHRPHHDSYEEDHYGRDAYSVVPSYAQTVRRPSSPSYKQTHVPHYIYRRKRRANKDDDEDGKDKKDDD